MPILALFFLLVIIAGLQHSAKHIKRYKEFLKMSRAQQESEIALANELLQRSHLKDASYSKEIWWAALFLGTALLCALGGYWFSAIWLAFIFIEVAEKTIRETILIKTAKLKDRDVLDGFVSEARMAY